MSTITAIYPQKMQQTARVKRRRKLLEGWLFIGPVVVGTLLFNVLPLFPTMYTSLTFWNGLSAPSWIGLENYRFALTQDMSFMTSLRNTVVYAVGAVPGAIIAGLALALIVNERLPGMLVARGLFFLPVVTSVVAVGMVWRWIFNWQFGLINATLETLGIIGPRWLSDPTMAMVAVIIVAIWQQMGYNMVLFLAGLQGIPPSLEEAAMIDGANAWWRFWHITLPLLTPTIFFVLIISVIGSFQIFGLIYTMTGGGPGAATYVYVYHMWYEGFQRSKFGYGAALAWMLFVVIALITWFQWWMGKRWVFYQ
ncbi:MAG: sugar ABC transporter permease [Caldilineaceae bacterium]